MHDYNMIDNEIVSKNAFIYRITYL